MSSVSASVVISKGGEARGDVAGEVGVFIVTVSCCACSWNCMCVGMWWRVRGLTQNSNRNTPTLSSLTKTSSDVRSPVREASSTLIQVITS